MKRKNSVTLSLLGITVTALSMAAGCDKTSKENYPGKPNPEEVTIPEVSSYDSLESIEKLPSPFEFMDGSMVASKEDWADRRAEIAALAQEFQYGYKPDTPREATEASFSDDSLRVTVTHLGKTVSFTSSVTYPETGTKPYPAVIAIGGSFISKALLEMGVAVINFPNNAIAAQDGSSSRGKGLFYDMYGSDHSASATMAWAWGVSRLIDAIEKTPAAGIDPERLGVTGCSRNGKGALVVGAFDDRIALTIPQEPGAGGAASWRISDAQLAAGKNVQTLSQIVGENVWFAEGFSRFSDSSDKLPFDQHSIMALVAPRALLVVENTSVDWLSPLSSWITANAAHDVWEALGVPERMGFSQVGDHPHCVLPDSQLPELTAYVETFLIGSGSGNTAIMKTDGDFTYEKETWADWKVPTWADWKVPTFF